MPVDRESVLSAGSDARDDKVRAAYAAIAASYAERVVFLADGRLVEELAAPTAERVAERIAALAA